MAQDRREHERILIEMPTRMWLDETIRGRDILFEGFARTRDLSIGGTFIKSTYLLPVGFPINLEMDLEDGQYLFARGEVIHTIGDRSDEDRGMGIVFTEVDSENRELLLRFFVSERIRDFYRETFLVQFPHLENKLSLQDVALVINLWEDKEGRLTALKSPNTERARANEAARARAAARHASR